MLLTEEEAKKKWCPMAQIIIGYNENVNSASNCIASECMAWRWAVIQPGGKPNPANGGYCGLAGKL